MTKRQLIDEILTINRSARPSFLAQFAEQDLGEYLEHLLAVREPCQQGDAWWPRKHLQQRPATPPAPLAQAEDLLSRAAAEPNAAAHTLADGESDAATDEAPAQTDRQTVLAAASAEPAPASDRSARHAPRASEKWLF